MTRAVGVEPRLTPSHEDRCSPAIVSPRSDGLTRTVADAEIRLWMDNTPPIRGAARRAPGNVTVVSRRL